MSANQDKENMWNYRITEQRQIRVKAKNASVRKISVIDILTNLPFPIEPAQKILLLSLELEKGYYATLKIYTSKKITDVDKSMVEFFEALDVNQSAEDFIKAYWLYPNLIRFVLIEAEPL